MARFSQVEYDEELTDIIGGFYDDPLGYVMFNFPWDTYEPIQVVPLPEKYRDKYGCEWGPDLWACEYLEQLGEEIRKRGFDGKRAVPPIRFSTASGHGIGKSVLSSLLVKFISDTRPFCRGTVTAGTVDQLKSKTWAEVGKWHRISLTNHFFNYSSGRGSMALRRKGFEDEWFVTAQTCKEENSEAFAGQHAVNSTSFYLFDEASGVPDKIYEVRAGGLTDGEPMVFDFGNPTQNSGAFFENTVGKTKNRYITRQIDARDVYITNKEYAQEMIDDFGINSDYVKVRVLGQFPSQGSLQFIGANEVRAAMVRPVEQLPTDGLVIGVDVARFGDDESVIYPRIGNDARSFAPVPDNGRYRGLSTDQLVDKIIETVQRFRRMGMPCSGLFIDGGNTGGAVVDYLRRMGYEALEVGFGTSPTDAASYRYKSDEIWGRMKEAIGKNLMLPNMQDQCGPNLYDQLTQRQYGYLAGGSRIHLETKKDMKARLGGECGSPDLADALAVTYAFEVQMIQGSLHGQQQGPQVVSEYDPHEARF